MFVGYTSYKPVCSTGEDNILGRISAMDIDRQINKERINGLKGITSKISSISSAGKKIPKYIMYIILSLYSLVCIYPFIWMVSFSLKNNQEIFVTNVFGLPKNFRIENYEKALKVFDVFLYFKNSIIVSTATVVITVVIALMFSYAAARMTWKFSTAARIYITTGMFIPVQIILIPLVILVRDLKLSNSYFPLIIAYSVFQLSFSSIVFYGFFRTIPFEIEEAAAIDGAGVFTTFFRIMLPLIKPAIATVVIFVFLYAWNEFTIALIMITDNSLKTLPLGIINFQGQFETDWGAMGATLTIASLPTMIVYLIFSEHIEKALTVSAAVKG